ncbi:MAG: metallo-beta-lactamase family protein [Conexibacter sp.]|nr:metallo-beta-lactamase family protein [Conexibacter sp.]
MSAAAELAPGLWRWTARHPDWHPGEFGAEVASFALVAGEELLLVDPLLPGDDDGDGPDAVLATLDALAAAAASTTVLITIGYHVRSAEPLRDRYDAPIHGPRTVAGRLGDTKAFTILEPGVPGPGGVVAHAIGRPRRSELPLWLPSHAALAFGDALVTTTAGELRMWCQEPRDEQRIAFYRDRFAPTLAALRDLPARRILTTHGPPILDDGGRHLAAALDAEPWFHHE